MTFDDSGLLSLPDELILLVLEHLPLKHLLTSRLVCKKWNHLVSEGSILRAKQLFENPRSFPWVLLYYSSIRGASFFVSVTITS